MTLFTLVNQKALVVAATLRSQLFNALEWAKNGEKGKQKIYLFLLWLLSELFSVLILKTLDARNTEKIAVYDYVRHLVISFIV